MLWLKSNSFEKWEFLVHQDVLGGYVTDVRGRIKFQYLWIFFFFFNFGTFSILQNDKWNDSYLIYIICIPVSGNLDPGSI